VVEFGGRTNGFVVEPGGKDLKQQDLREIGWAFGRGAVHYLEPPGEMFILGGRAYVLDADGEVRTADVLINTEYALGIGRDSRATAMLHLPAGSPVTLDIVLAEIGDDLEGPVAVLGAGSFATVHAKPGGTPSQSRFSAWWKSRFEAPVRTGLVFLAFRTAGPEAEPGAGDRWQVHGLLTAQVPESGPAGTPGEILARVLEAEPRTPTPVSTDSAAVELALAVYHLAGITPATEFIEPPLVEIDVVDPTIVLDVRYAGTDNFAGRAIYPAARAYLVLPEAERLARVNARLREQGFLLKVYDAYRPFSDHVRLWELAPDKRFWAHPDRGSRHSRGAAVDCTLVTLDGREVEMPTGFDDFTRRAHRDYQGASEAARRHRAILEAAMTAEGFIPLAKEWWHFDSPVWWEYPLRDIPLAAAMDFPP
jgi:D-alanyl-D-alanine dipeptidase